MDKSSLVEIIKILEPDEQSDFISFLKSPYFNKSVNKNYIQNLYTIILDKILAGQEIKKEELYEILYSGTMFIEGKLDKLMVELNKLLRSFLLINEYLHSDNEFNYTFDLSKIFRARGLESKYNQLINKLNLIQKNEKRKTNKYYFRQYLIENEKYDLENYYNRQKGDLNVPNAIYSLDIFHTIKKLDLFNSILLQKKITNVEIPVFLTKTLNSFNIPELNWHGDAIFLIITKIFMLLRSEDGTISDFNDLSDFIKNNESEIDPTLLQDYYAYLRNISTLMHNSGIPDMSPLIFNLQKEHLNRGYLYVNGKITQSAYSNTVNLAIRLQENEWAYNFIETHKDLIIGENPGRDYYHLNLSRYYFATKRFKDALDILPQSFPEPVYNNLARRLELKIYFETDSPLLSYKIDSFKMFISRASHKYLPPRMREYQNNFINLFFQITQSIQKDKIRSERLIQRINAKKFVADREWLLEKAAEIAVGKSKI